MSKSLSRNGLLRSAIFEYVLRSGAAGYTDAEIAEYIGVSASRVRTQRLALVQTKHLMALHPRRRTANGYKAPVWLTTKVVTKVLVHRAQKVARISG